MTTLARKFRRRFYLDTQAGRRLRMLGSDTIFGGAALGDNGSKYMRPLEAGDPFRGFAAETAENESGAAGDQRVEVYESGSVELPVTGVTGIGNKDAKVYAVDDDSFTLTKGSNSYVGYIKDWLSGTKALVVFDARRSALAPVGAELTDSSTGTASDTIAAATNTDTLTDSSGGAADDTISAIGDTSTSNEGAVLNNNFKEVADQLATQKALNTVLTNAVASLAAKVNEILEQLQ